MIILLVLLLIAHLASAVYFSIKIMNTGLLTIKQKSLNIVLLFTIPSIWCSLIFYVLKKQPGSHNIPVKNDVSTKEFHESKTGYPM
ncbi:hypothetical protein CLV57_2158 [Mucilaginibacter auburnensis]|uniref:Phospholipase D-like protein n=1 Tax=Mucilaginibacter auburnensis TaxID=1457233 RepID=A0A2H9VL17_9SPHI|nr:hypothetical protein CLV57_2158 [Mucilaginibacter auburnensis]